MSIIDTTEQSRLATRVLRVWADGIRAHEPNEVASVFTEDAVFQGFDPTHTVGRAGIAAYYDKQPVGLRAAFHIAEQRQIAADALLVYARVDFSPPDAAVIPVHLTAVLRRSAEAWLISHYHVSKIERPSG
ncbi:SgcJ/EcaC family oxidoreductase [Agromyces humatus]|uniref:SgcJ/EcaC family oxidoreductase n=1 Tax=Agromyces humatus TaxID=279573 RepID=A0ABP4WSB6_9MICO|nr:SgcJ/EcaC family oxidoreductase [Agromyces humatus]